ncbi:hypothetical protein TREMEDRAFT_60835 [Tremella mesenterica DSM 1558]|uniref:uncharacterized protein n=1 Tax=Tremella mesenterica (strain ATCC 24925 / CBS 8224 / DSM 1558 / NBRC 9311 / NRRL Y-6157 / RJB 2259-6 / UBC 559-6) TaxID=578456 RepID=UPI0003F4958C|nr:uncharacterized protein TREMEDRAFT_60835 [Tremella mesenterica DSM 1558]EIW70345.1 hypothetical protein TREMEDRAFT_60835 [Tremella mesenterica DSM 1558]
MCIPQQQQQNTVDLVRGIVGIVLSSRMELYDRPSLRPVANNGGDRINKKTQSLLKAWAKSVPGAEKVVIEELARVTISKGYKKKTRVSPKKNGGGGNGLNLGGESSPMMNDENQISRTRKMLEDSPSKKRKKEDEKEEEEEFEMMFKFE